MLKYAEKLFNLLDQDKVSLDYPQLETPSKIDGRANFIQLHLIANKKRMFSFQYGPSAGLLEFILTEDEAFKNLASTIKNFEVKIKFHALVLPSDKQYSATKLIWKNVFIRHISYYEIKIDEYLNRYDVLIEKV